MSIHRRFRPLVEDELDGLSDAATRLVAEPGAPSLAAEPGPDRVLPAVGPEGGWVPFELELLHQHGFRPLSLGPRTLRSDTACIAAIAVAQSCRLQVSSSTSA